ncbi:MAG: hypothetical protein Q8N77_06575 [Nanoarchaeota archaeon]|nr:hypothetical protein [Nanoarchaeota archaeon]
MEKTGLQKLIVEKHLADDFPLLKKYPISSLGSGIGSDDYIFFSNYGLVGLVPHDCPEEHRYLPHFEFSVTTHYTIKVPHTLICEKSVIEYLDDSVKVCLKSRDNSLIEVLLPKAEGLFQLRSLESEGKILAIPKTKEEYKDKLPIDESQIKLGFTFRASSTTFGQLCGLMDINHPAAEELIKEYLGTIDKRFADYAELKKHFREKDDKGNVLWEDQNLQSNQYNSKRKKLHKAMFGDLKKVLKKGSLKIEDYT